MPFLARRGSISTRAYGQLSKKNIPTSTTWSGQSIFDNNNDINYL